MAISILITRSGCTVIATDDGQIMRSWECRSIRAAVALELKLTSDRIFADWWATQN